MPFVRCVYSGDAGVHKDISSAISSTVASVLNKPETAMFVEVVHSISIRYAGSTEPCAFLHIEAIGDDPNALERLAPAVTDVLESVGGINPTRVCMNYKPFARNEWAAHGVTYAHPTHLHHVE